MTTRIRSILLLLFLAFSCGQPRSPQPPPPGIDHLSDGLKSPAAAEEAPPGIAEENSFRYIEQYVGRYPGPAKLFDTEPLHERLTELLGDQYRTFLQSMEVTSPIKRSEAGIYYFAGRGRGTGSDNRAYLLIDPVLNQMEAGLILEGSYKRFRGPDKEIPVPPEIRMLVEEATFRPE